MHQLHVIEGGHCVCARGGGLNFVYLESVIELHISRSSFI